MAGAPISQYSRFLNFHGRNPDVLNSIANLSNDEVFTPPEFANQMLDTLQNSWAESFNGENLWTNPDLKFLDPFTKSGVFLREITTRLIRGLEPQIPDLQSRIDHILTKQIFGIATTHLTSLMARRSLYCSKKANGKHSITNKFKDESGNIWFQPMSHSWKNGTLRELTMDEGGKEVERYVDGNCKYCGASKMDFERQQGLELHAYGLIHVDDPKKWLGTVYGENMQFDVIIGNPPYQLSDKSDSSSASPIYNLFVQQAKLLSPRMLSMVIPARWYTGGKGLDNFRKEMAQDKHLKILHDYFDASDVFPGVDISGGICYFLWDQAFLGDCEITNHLLGRSVTKQRPLRHAETGTIVRFNEAVGIVNKVTQKSLASFADHVSPRQPFGLSTTPSLMEKGDEDATFIYAYPKNGFVSTKSLTRNVEWINKWKVMSAKAYGERGSFPYLVTGKPFIGAPGTACSETYLVTYVADTEDEAHRVATYMRTRFFRFLVLMSKNTQNAASGVYRLVPSLDFSLEWTDELLAAHFELDSDEVNFIRETVRPMGESI
jgi:site-specific DNA-methyltransferase (adenine-specific)